MARSSKAKPTAKASGKGTVAPGGASVRMYRQGLGDCFLITLAKQDKAPWRMLIDCGVIQGASDATDRLKEVIADIVTDTKGRVDVLALTHEHYDHIAAFAVLPELFCSDADKRKDEQLQIGEVWFAWTEDPNDPLGRKLNKARADQVSRLSALVGRLRMTNQQVLAATSSVVDGIGHLMSFFGLSREDLADASSGSLTEGMAARGAGGPRRLGPTARAMQRARELGGSNGECVRYWKPEDQPWFNADLPGVRIFVLGPPRDERMLKKTFATNEVYHLASSDAGNEAFFGAAALTGADSQSDDWCPFDQAYGRPLHEPQPGVDGQMPEVTAEFLRRHYYGPSSDPGVQDQSWRRIDEDWLGSAVQFALKLDSATNNTSLVLAIELSPGGSVLLFPADAQVGNWLSWQNVKWTLDDEKTVSASDLLKHTVFYKVGHHGSHNATLREHGLELMPHGLTAVIPVEKKMAEAKGWTHMPLPGLLAALEERDCVVVRMDGDLSTDKRFRASDKRGKSFEGPLFYEWTLER